MKKILIATILMFFFAFPVFAAEETDQNYVLVEELDRVKTNATIKVHFNTEMDFYTIGSNVYVLDAKGEKVDVYVGLDKSMKTILVTPKGSWQKGRSYTVYIENDFKGLNKKNLKENYIVRFSTEPLKGKIVK